MKAKLKNEVRKHFLASLTLLFITAGLSSQALGARHTFKSYNIKSNYKEISFFDFDGDGLDDVIINNEPNLVFFLQNPRDGFTKAPNLVYLPDDKPSVVWPAKFGNNPAQNILIMPSSRNH